MTRGPTIRPWTEADDPGIVQIHHLQEADSAPLTLERLREERAEAAADRPREEWVAVDGGRVLGYAGFHPAWWTGDPGVYAVEIRVHPEQQRRGVGAGLYERLHSRLLSEGAARLLAWVREDSEGGRSFAASHGFRETGQVIQEYRLHIPDAATDAYASVEERLSREGLRIASLAELDLADEGLLRALHRLWAGSEGEADDLEAPGVSFADWQREVLHGPGLSPETHWVALEGGRPVGMSFLNRLSADAAENDYTGVAATHRGRRIAPALKLRTIAWAREAGVRWFYTSTEVGNAAMIAVNRRLGYREGVRRLEVEGRPAGDRASHHAEKDSLNLSKRLKERRPAP